MNNTSATGGFLRLSPAPGQVDIEDVIHDLIAGITGICGELVRPRWQPDPPREPKPEVNWCAFGITGYEPLNFPEIRHHGEGEGRDEIVDYENLAVLASFYGPRHVDLARQCRRSLHVPQNRAGLRPHGLAFVRAGTIIPVPALVAMGWRARADLPLTFQLMTSQSYAVLSLKQANGTIVTEQPQDGGRPGMTVPLGCQACSRACWRES